MFGSPILETFASLILIYVVLSLIVTSVVELVSTLLRQRAVFLKQAVKKLLPNTGGFAFSDSFLSHHLIAGPTEDDLPLSSYLSGKQFSTVLLDILRPANLEREFAFDQIKRVVMDLPQGSIKSVLRPLVLAKDATAETVQLGIAQWFEASADRVSGWYKRWCQKFSWIVSIMIVVLLNADTVRILQVIWENPNDRANLTKTAEGVTAEGTGQGRDASLEVRSFPLGWKAKDWEIPVCEGAVGLEANRRYPFQFFIDGRFCEAWICFWSDLGSLLKLILANFLLHFLGWFLTVAAISLGAPFWFDFLVKMMNLRGTGKVPEK